MVKVFCGCFVVNVCFGWILVNDVCGSIILLLMFVVSGCCWIVLVVWLRVWMVSCCLFWLGFCSGWIWILLMVSLFCIGWLMCSLRWLVFVVMMVVLIVLVIWCLVL